MKNNNSNNWVMNRLELLNEFANSAGYHILRWFSGSSELILTKSSSLDPKKASIKMQFQTYSLFSPRFFFFSNVVQVGR